MITDGREVEQLSPRDSFGEGAILSGRQRRTARVVARTSAKLLRLSASVVVELLPLGRAVQVDRIKSTLKVKSAWNQSLETNVGGAAFKFWFQFQLAPLRLGLDEVLDEKLALQVLRGVPGFSRLTLQILRDSGVSGVSGRGLHSSTSQLNLSRF